MPKPSNTDIRPPITPPETFFNLKSGWDDGLTGPLDPVLDPFFTKQSDSPKFEEEIATINFDSLNAELAAWQESDFVIIDEEYLEDNYDYIFRATNGKDDIDGTGFVGGEDPGNGDGDDEDGPDGIIVAGDGKDYIEMDATRDGRTYDFIVAGNGKDTVKGGHRMDYIFGENGDDQLWGENGGDIISGGNGDDDIYGGIGEDQIIGGRDDGTFLVLRTQEIDDDLVENGSFEDFDEEADNIIEKSGGDWYLINDLNDQGEDSAVPYWSNDAGGPIELQLGGTGGVDALEGNVKLELDSDSDSSFVPPLDDDGSTPLVTQDLPTIADQTYTLEFGAYERENGTSDFVLYWDGETIEFEFDPSDGGSGDEVSFTNNIAGATVTVTYPSSEVDGWNEIEVTGLVASSNSTTIGFQGLTEQEDSLGAFIDQVEVLADNSAAAFTLAAGDELWGGDKTNLEDGQADTFYYDFGRGDGVDLIYGFELPEEESDPVIDIINIANLDGYTPVIIEDGGGDIIAFLEDEAFLDDEIPILPGSFQEDAAIQLVGVDTQIATFESAEGQGWLVT